MMDLSGVIRVSTARQADAYGPDAQRADIRAWAKETGNKVTRWYSDAAGSDLDDLESRTGLRDALADIKAGRVAGIVVGRLDRLARDLILQETILRDIQGMGGALFSTSAIENAYIMNDDADPAREMIRVILSAVGRYEKKMIRLRMANGRKVKRAGGGYAGDGSPRFGVRADGGELVADPAEQATLSRMRGLRDAGMSYADIADTLNTEGMLPKRGGRWHPMTVSRALSR
jgi:DNA invertase Pin-like site-specific DNA recombinase